MTPDEKIRRGKRTEEFTANPLVVEAFTSIEADLINDWKTSKTADERESLHRELSLLQKVRGKLDSFIHDGQIAATRANRL